MNQVQRLVLVVGFLLVAVAATGCEQKADDAPGIVKHSIPALGIRTVDIEVPDQGVALDLRWQYGIMAAPERYASLAPGSTARIVIVEDLNDTCGVYISHGGSTNKLTLPLPKPEPGKQMSGKIIFHSPSLSQIREAPREVIRMEWISGVDPEKTDKRVMFIAFEVAEATE